ncbi:MAG: LptE family protein [Syntrophales bacterium]|nr:LptE family protein [Syntrophales bacterium]
MMNALRNVCRIVAAIMAIFMIYGCGYEFAAGGEYIDKTIKNVYVEPVVNKTSEANAENMFRAAFMDWFNKGGRFRVVDREEQADAVWRATISTLTTSVLSYQTTNLASEERMTVVMDLRFEERESKKAIWSDRAFSGLQDYPVSTAVGTESARSNALSRLSDYTAERAYRMMMSGF